MPVSCCPNTFMEMSISHLATDDPGTSLELWLSALLPSAGSHSWHTEQERLDGWVTAPQAELVGFEHIN